jgi:hypothetical protein
MTITIEWLCCVSFCLPFSRCVLDGTCNFPRLFDGGSFYVRDVSSDRAKRASCVDVIQVNLSGAYGVSVRVPIPAIDLRSLALAWRQESSWQQKALSIVSSALLPSKAQQTKQSLQARLRHLDDQLLIGVVNERGSADAAAHKGFLRVFN